MISTDDINNLGFYFNIKERSKTDNEEVESGPNANVQTPGRKTIKYHPDLNW